MEKKRRKSERRRPGVKRERRGEERRREERWKRTLVNVEFPHALRALKRLEAVERDLGRASDKLQKEGLLLLGKGPQHGPKPGNLRGERGGREKK